MPETTAHLRLLVGYDGSEPANRALDGAVNLLSGRDGDITVVYVAHLPSVDMLSADAIVQMEADFDIIEKDLRNAVAARLDGRGIAWHFVRRQGMIGEQLIEAAHDAEPGTTTVLVVGSSSSASHRILGGVAVALARHAPVPVVIVP